MKKKILVTLLGMMFLTGCTCQTDVVIDENGKYTVTATNIASEEEQGYATDEYATQDMILSNTSNIVVNNDTFIARPKKGITVEKGSVGVSSHNGKTTYTVDDAKLTVTMPKEVKHTNGEIDSENPNRVIFDVTKNEKSYYAFTDDREMEYTAPKVSGVKNGKLYSDAVTIKVRDNIAIKTIELNGKKIENNTKVTKNGAYVLKAEDTSGNATWVSFFIFKDNTFPKIYFDKSDFWMTDGKNIGFLKELKTRTIKTDGYLYISDKAEVKTKVSKEFYGNLPISELKNLSLSIKNDKYYLCYSKRISSLSSVKINEKVCKIKKNGVKLKLKKNESYVIDATDKSGNKLTTIVMYIPKK